MNSNMIIFVGPKISTNKKNPIFRQNYCIFEHGIMDINESTILDFFDQIRQKTTDEWQDEMHVKIKLQDILKSQKGFHPTKTLSEQGLLRINTKRLQPDLSIENHRSTSASGDYPADTPLMLNSPLSPSFRTPAFGPAAGDQSFRIVSPLMVIGDEEEESPELPPDFGVTWLFFPKSILKELHTTQSSWIMISYTQICKKIHFWFEIMHKF